MDNISHEKQGRVFTMSNREFDVEWSSIGWGGVAHTDIKYLDIEAMSGVHTKAWVDVKITP